jgi:tetratricopeptide (TPR) repeat protein
VCQAIQHAHQKGIIHRDIKPSNVLVTMHDGSPLTKVIDFGIAKATMGRLIDQTLHTEVDQIMGTPAYISPEQARPTHIAIDTRSDIYSLGVLLYELLTSHTPFDADELAEAGIEKLRERICTEEPPRPSLRLASLDAMVLSRIAVGRETTPAKLIKQVGDDLDWIVMQCMDKEPQRRYQTVNELITDIEHYLRHEPVHARPPTFLYSLRKLARRNRIAFASGFAAVAFVFFLAIFAVTMTLQAQRVSAERDRAERERRQAQKVSNVALRIFAIADPFQTQDGNFSPAVLLTQAAKSIEGELGDQPMARAQLLQAVGRAYSGRGELTLSIEYMKEAVRILTQMENADRECLTAMIDLSAALRASGDLQGARDLLSRGDDLATRRGLKHSAAYARLLMNRARLEMVEGRIPEAQADLNSSLQLFRNTVGAQSPQVAEVMGDLSETFLWTDNLAKAEQIARYAVDIFQKTVPSTHPDLVGAQSVLAEALYLQGQLDEAAMLLVDVVEKHRQLFGYNSAQAADSLDRLALVRYSEGRFDESETTAREALATVRIAFGERHIMTGSIATTLARTLFRVRKFHEAEAVLREVIDNYNATLPPDHQYIASAEYFLGEVLLATKRPREAEAILIASMNRWTRGGAPRWRAMRSASALGEALYRQGRTQEAEQYLSESVHVVLADPNADSDAKRQASERFARYVKKSSMTQRAAPATQLTVATQ